LERIPVYTLPPTFIAGKSSVRVSCESSKCPAVALLLQLFRKWECLTNLHIASHHSNFKFWGKVKIICLVDRDRIYLVIAFPVILAACALLWKEYVGYYGKSPTSDLPTQVSLPVSLPASSSAASPAPAVPGGTPNGTALEEAPRRRSAQDQETVRQAKTVLASSLDSSLPNQALGDWIAQTAGASARVLWEANHCDEEQPHDSLPVCAQANVDFNEGTKFQALLLVGSQPLKPRGAVQYSEPSLMWSVYQKPGATLSPAPLSALQRIAKEAR